MAPTDEQITVSLDALERDAVRWTHAAAELRTAAATAAAVTLDPAVFSFAGDAMAASYEALRAKTAALLTDGAANFDAIAAALRAAAAVYAADEAANAHALQNNY